LDHFDPYVNVFSKTILEFYCQWKSPLRFSTLKLLEKSAPPYVQYNVINKKRSHLRLDYNKNMQNKNDGKRPWKSVSCAAYLLLTYTINFFEKKNAQSPFGLPAGINVSLVAMHHRQSADCRGHVPQIPLNIQNGGGPGYTCHTCQGGETMFLSFQNGCSLFPSTPPPCSIGLLRGLVGLERFWQMTVGSLPGSGRGALAKAGGKHAYQVRQILLKYRKICVCYLQYLNTVQNLEEHDSSYLVLCRERKNILWTYYSISAK
jgi:hypothetical protein